MLSNITSLKVLITAVLLNSLAFSTQTLVYTKSSGSHSAEITWKIDEKEKSFVVESSGKDSVTNIEASSPYKTEKFSYRSLKNSNTYTFTRSGKKLEAKGMRSGEPMSEVYEIGNKNWVQEFELGLKPFLHSEKSSYKFVILNPKSFKLFNMVATKQDVEELEVEGKKHKAQKVKVTLQGFKSMFWKAQVWYDVKTHNMLVYKANEGPHTPLTTISLKSADGQAESLIERLEDKVEKAK